METFKASVLVSLTLFGVGVFLLAARANRVWPAAAVCAGAWLSQPLFTLHYGYLKQTFGLALLVVGFALLSHWLSGKRESLLMPIVSVGLLFAGSITHIFTAFLGALLLAAVLFEEREAQSVTKICVPVLVAVLAGLLVYQKNLLGALRFESALPWDWHESINQIDALQYAQFHLYAGVAVIGAAAALYFRVRSLVFWLLMAGWLMMIAPIWPREFGAGSYRWLLTSVPVFFVLCAALIRDLPLMRSVSGQLKAGAFLALLCAPPFVLNSTAVSVGPSMPIDLLERNAGALTSWIPDSATVVAPHGIQFRVSYFLGRDARREPRPDGNAPLFAIVPASEEDPDCTAVGDVALISKDTECVRLDSQWVVRKLGK